MVQRDGISHIGLHRECKTAIGSMNEMYKMPALYNAASALSQNSQTTYLRLIRWEYSLLVLASVLSLDLSKDPLYYIAYAAVFALSLGALIWRTSKKPEQSWYKGRALAESIKTSCWRYCMCAEPFGIAENKAQRRADFRNHLRQILQANRHIGDSIPPDSAAEDQVTSSMEGVRDLPLEDKKEYYKNHRIRDQRTWYAAKAGSNRKASNRWMAGGIIAYFVAILLSLTRIAYPNWSIWPIEPVIVIASSIIGWTQVKKFNELASSYTLTAHEIGLIQSRLDEISDEHEFSEFVNEAEQAFSREHTQWVARQQYQ